MVAEMQNIPFPKDLLAKLEPQAKRIGLTVPEYLALLARVETSGLDARAQDAARFVLTKHAASLRKLAQ